MLSIGVVLCAVSSITYVASNAWFIQNGSRSKREDNWSWGLEEKSQQNSQMEITQPTTSVNPLTTTDADADICAPYAPTMPNLFKLGRRVSEIKCYEYMWQMKNREEKAQKEKACVAYNRRKLGINIHKLIIGGRGALSGEYPHMGAIGWKAAEGTWIFKCGGALISPNFVLTAAHCTRASRDTSLAEPEPKIVRLGDKNILDVESKGIAPHDETILRIIVHPSYTAPKKYNDIALLQLTNNVDFTKLIQPACLWQSSVSVGKANITGWGVVESGGRQTSPDLQTAEVDIVDSATCEGLLRRWCNRLWCGVRDSQLCAGLLAGGVDSCQGDSGSPLQVKIPVPPALGSMHYIVGVTSFGFGCARAAAPGLYTRVYSFLDWIEGVVWN